MSTWVRHFEDPASAFDPSQLDQSFDVGMEDMGSSFCPQVEPSISRWRDLLPLPFVNQKGVSHCGAFQSVGAKRRSVRRSSNAEIVNGIVTTLNEMAGFAHPSNEKPSKAQKLAHQQLFCQVARMPRCAHRVQMREAVHELLHTGLSPYATEDEARSTVRSYSKGLVSLPESGASVFQASELLDEAGRDFLLDPQTHLFVEHFDAKSKVKPYMDEVLRFDDHAYHDFIGDLWERGMLTFGHSCRASITPFFVVKKSGKLRLVLDCRQANEHFKPPPDIAMAAGYSFGQLVVEHDQEVFVAQSDIKDYFYSIGLPDYLHPFFSLPPIRSDLLSGRIPELCGRDPSLVIFPQMKVVPMGWSWAMFFAQRIHQHQVMIGAGIPHHRVLADGRPAPVLKDESVVIVPYADNLNVIGTNKDEVQRVKDQAVAQLRKVGFRVHEEEDASLEAKALGFIINGSKRKIFPVPEKRDKVIQCLIWLSRRPRVSGRVVERIIGHCVHFFMLRREMLSIFRSVYDFKTAHYNKQVRLWRSAADECRWAANLLWICESDMGKQWSGEVTVSDACLSGTATCSMEIHAKDAAEIGSTRELWRYKSRSSCVKAREIVRQLDPFKDIETVSAELPRLDPFQLNLDFQNVPQELAQSDHWKVQFSSRMFHKEPITVIEGRATVQSIRHKTRSCKHFNKRHLHFGDNLGMVLAFDRGRAKSFSLLVCCRRACAFSLAAGCQFHHRWLPSEWNKADGPSRKWEGEAVQAPPSKRGCQRTISEIIYPTDSARQLEAVGKVKRWASHPCSKGSGGQGDQAQGASVLQSNAHDREGKEQRGKTKESSPGDQRKSKCPTLCRSDSFRDAGSFTTHGIDYHRRVLVFQNFCSLLGLRTSTSSQVDHALTVFFNQSFEEGLDISEAQKAFAAVQEAFPVVGRQGLSRSRRSLKGWKNLDPGQSRTPLAWPFISLLALTMMQLGEVRCALCILTMFTTYIRPCEALKLLKRDVVRSTDLGVSWALNVNTSEEAQQSKVGLQDEAMLLDNKMLDYLGPALGVLAQGLPFTTLFEMQYPQLHRTWHATLAHLGLPMETADLYQLRHSGASWDRLKKVRSLLEIKLRGRWSSDASLKRYESHAKVAQLYEKLPDSIKKRADSSPQLLKEMVIAFTSRHAPTC